MYEVIPRRPQQRRVRCQTGCRRRGADESEKLKQKQNVEAAKARQDAAVNRAAVNTSLQQILPARRFGAGKRSIFAQRPKHQLNARSDPAAAAAAAAPRPVSAEVAVRPASGLGASSTGGLQRTEADKKRTLGVPDLLVALNRDPVYARSAAHHRLQLEHAAECAVSAISAT